MMTLLGKGVLRLAGSGDKANQSFEVAGGFLQVADDMVRVVTEHASAVNA
jgi:F-type H+-transporting ATPase subunit epsilon